MAVMDRIATARDDGFAARVAMILMALAINVANEDEATPNHANRVALANLHLRALVNCKAVSAAVIASNATIAGSIDADPGALGADVPDSDIEFVLGGLFNHLANAYAGG